MNVVSFYAPRPDHPKFQDYQPHLAVLEASCRRFGHEHIVLTDDASLSPAFLKFYTILPENLMRACLAAQLAYLRSPLAGTDTVLLGADCVVAGNVSAAFDGTFDLGVTTYPFSDCWLNTGAIFVPGGSNVTHIWEAALARCRGAWGDDQLALASALDPVSLDHSVQERAGVRVRFMPVDPWNLAPKNMGHDCRHATVLHFRGPRKKWMAEYCRRWLALEPVEVTP
jgi:hypothetical protein